MTDAALPPAPAPGAPAPAVTIAGLVAPAAPVVAEGGVMPGFAQILGGMGDGNKQTPQVPGAARATITLPKPPPVEAESPASPSPILPPQESPLPLATVAVDIPIKTETRLEAPTDTDAEKTETPSKADEPVALLTPPLQPAIAAPTPPPAQHQPARATAPTEDLPATDPETPPRVLQSGPRRQEALIVAPPPSDMTEPRTPSQPGHTSSSPEQQDDATSAAPSPSPTLALPDQPATPSAPARAATQIISTAPGRFGEELGIAIARHASRGESGAAETLSLRLDPPEHGRIEVTLSFEDGGPLRAVVAASQPATLDLLRRDSADLGRALGQAGIGTDAQSFSFSAQSQGSGRERQGQSFPPQPTPPNSWAMAPEEIPLPAPDYRPLHTSGRLNLIA
ncbi:flagellar hook-length control protein FliK [Sphingobium sp. DEHP117]|uniref:flagellar hook-length control protein FliK n=1 Tax=Sphingobium sp. DEHP117 TaxID=2993436 RepID=UPI0027D5107F|nr:flagellar hook-length control protein FliK [Sphingobium sp. DEHP117]MDQ4421125.1 flagellar hook-length control protein FliK [Sphingobium sp. DEHP117]